MESPEFAPPRTEEVVVEECYCCGFTEVYTPAYVAKVRASHQGRCICGLCQVAIKDENSRSRRGISDEEAMNRHVSFCQQFRKSSQLAKQKETLISAMKQLLRRRREALACRPALARSKSCFAAVAEAHGDGLIEEN